MTGFDIFVLIIILALLIRGIWIGFIRQIAFFLALILGFIFAGTLTVPLARLVGSMLATPLSHFFLIYLLLFGSGALAVVLAGRSLLKLVEAANLSWLDRAFGGILGLCKALFIASFIFLMAMFLWPPNRDSLKSALFYPLLSKSSMVLMSFVKDEELRYYFLGKKPTIQEDGDFSIPASPAVPSSERLRRNSI